MKGQTLHEGSDPLSGYRGDIVVGVVRKDEEVAAVFVRVPRDAAEKLDRVAYESGAPKREIVARLLTDHLDGTTTPPEPLRLPARDGMALGRHAFRPVEQPEVLTLAQAAELLQVGEDTVRELAESGELPGRAVGGEWRFARAALLAWLSGP